MKVYVLIATDQDGWANFLGVFKTKAGADQAYDNAQGNKLYVNLEIIETDIEE